MDVAEIRLTLLPGILSLAMDTLGSLIFPPSAQAEGWYYFGITLFIILVWFLIDFVFKSVLSKQNRITANLIVVTLLVVFVILTSWVTYGVDSPLFLFLWKYMPFFSSLRTWGRLNIVVLLLIAPVLAFALEAFRQNLDFFKSNKRTAIQSALVLTGIGVVVGLVQNISTKKPVVQFRTGLDFFITFPDLKIPIL